MADHKLDVNEEPVEASAETNQGDITSGPARKPYTVLAEDGIFKNGKLHKKGATIELDERTATNFKELGEIEDAKS